MPLLPFQNDPLLHETTEYKIVPTGNILSCHSESHSFAQQVVLHIPFPVCSPVFLKPRHGCFQSPLSYAQNALAANEFTAPRWGKPYSIPSVEIFGHVKNNLTMGEQLLLSRGLHTPRWWVWVGVGTMIGYYILL
jgi:hypothetical protein